MTKEGTECFPCSEAETLGTIKSDVAWIKKYMEDKKKANLPERVTSLETHKSMINKLAIAMIPTLLGTFILASWAWLKHIAGGE
jgi:hypothetical protein